MTGRWVGKVKHLLLSSGLSLRSDTWHRALLNFKPLFFLLWLQSLGQSTKINLLIRFQDSVPQVSLEKQWEGSGDNKATPDSLDV